MTASLPQPMRLREGGLINRNRPLTFTFDRRVYQGYEGDSLASALLASGVKLFGRSFKYHRPRGVFSAGPEEPSALVEIDQGKAERDPNHRAPMVELYDGLETFSQNHIGPLGLDLMEANDLISRFLPAGFYYKTFFFGGLQAWYRFYEPIIRRAAGLGRPPMEADPHHYDKIYTFADTLVVGGGIAGLTTALSLARAGQSVLVCDERDRVGGAALWQGERFDGQSGAAYVDHLVAEIEAAGGRVLPRTTVFGVYDGGTYGALERCHDHLAKADRRAHTARMKYHRIQADRVVYATGAIERSVGFMGNDRPGVMLASAGHAYLGRYGVRVGQQPTIFTTNDGGYAVAAALARHGCRRDPARCTGGFTAGGRRRPRAAWGPRHQGPWPHGAAPRRLRRCPERQPDHRCAAGLRRLEPGGAPDLAHQRPASVQAGLRRRPARLPAARAGGQRSRRRIGDRRA